MNTRAYKVITYKNGLEDSLYTFKYKTTPATLIQVQPTGTFWFDLGCLLTFGVPKWERGTRVCHYLDWGALGEWFAELFESRGTDSGGSNTSSSFDIFGYLGEYPGSPGDVYWTPPTINPPSGGMAGPYIEATPPPPHDPESPFLYLDDIHFEPKPEVPITTINVIYENPYGDTTTATRRLSRTPPRNNVEDLWHANGFVENCTGILFCNSDSSNIPSSTLRIFLENLFWVTTWNATSDVKNLASEMLQRFYNKDSSDFTDNRLSTM